MVRAGVCIFLGKPAHFKVVEDFASRSVFTQIMSKDCVPHVVVACRKLFYSHFLALAGRTFNPCCRSIILFSF